ncbi:MAG: CehA/McbA family metallohydrolase [Lacunisphaera sp.]
MADARVAEEMSNFADFSARLLYWMDTPREPIVFGSQVLKASLMPFYDEWNGHAGPPGAAANLARKRIAEGYRALAGPRLLRIVIDGKVSITPPAQTDGLLGEKLEVPCVIENRRQEEVSVAVRGPASIVLTELKLLPGQSSGAFLSVPSPPAAPLALTAEIAGEPHALTIPVVWHQPGRLEVSIVDGTGAPTPARVYLTGPDRRAYAPAGAMHRIVSGDYSQPYAGDPYFHADGRFTVTVPSGEVDLEVVKGFEYVPVHLRVPVAAGRTASPVVRLERRQWVKKEGWYSGDSHVHANLFAQKLITPADARLIGKAEDINVLNLLPCNDPRTVTITDLQYFTGRPDAGSDRETVLYFSEEMRNDLFGHVGFLGLKKFVEPAYYGWPHSPFPYDYPGNTPQCADAKAQGALVTYVHPGLPSGFPVDIALGVADTIDVMSQFPGDQAVSWWYKLLNCGFRCPASAGPDSFLNIPVHLVPGSCRVYVNVGQTFTYDRWLDGLKHGRSFVTNGPLLRFAVNGIGAGNELVSAGPLVAHITGTAESNVPLDGLDVIVNGEVVRHVPAGGDSHRIELAETVTLERSGWVALRATGAADRLVTIGRQAYAHTSPVYVTIAGGKPASREAAKFFIGQIDALIKKIDSRGRYGTPAQRDEVVARCRQAQEIYRRMAAEGS